ncbi:hypothetical protein AALF20_12835 [Enterococcus avium]|uniref:hypothetical protein n=1 Tax=Enterococcus avium TaxID=33945 RepID=UPI0035199D16
MNQYHLDKRVGDTAYFFIEDEMINHLNKQNKKQDDTYRGLISNPLLPVFEHGISDEKTSNSFEEFEPMVKPEYRFLALELYSTLEN